MKHAFLTLLLFTSFSVAAQQSVKEGIAAYNRGDYERAVDILSIEMGHAAQLSFRDRANGWYYLGLSKTIVISNAMHLGDATNLQRLLGYDLDGYMAFKNALEEKANAPIRKDIEKEIKNLSYILFNSGNMQYLKGEYSFALKFYNAAQEIAETYGMDKDYQVYQFKGQVYLELTDSTKAYSFYSKAIDRYQALSPEIPDANIGYAFYTMAVIERYSNKDLDKALTLVQQGTAFVDSEVERLTGLLSTSEGNTTTLLNSQEEQFSQVRDVLSRFELDIYNASPEKYDEAVATFEKAIAANPEDDRLLLAYGHLIERNDPKKALEIYTKATQLAPNEPIGFFNAGAILVNEGVEYARLGNEEMDFQKAEEWHQKTNEAFAKALPFLEKAHALESDNIYVIDALLQVTVQLEMMDAYKMYKEKQNALRGY